MKVSIVTPSYNQGQFIARTLESVANQRSPHFELEHAVFDGGSTDDTVNILERFTHPVRWVSKPDRGQTNAVNMGISATDGEIIGWLNSDDIYYPNAIEVVVKYFIDHPEVDVIYGQADHIDVDDFAFESYPTESWDFERLKETCFICQPALFFRRRVVEANGPLNESLNFCMDYEYWLRLGKAGVRFAYLDEKLAGSRLYAENKTLGSRLKVHKEINDMAKQVLGVVPDKWLFNYAHAKLDNQLGIVGAGGEEYAFSIGIKALLASLRWNFRVSKEMRRIILGYFGIYIKLITRKI